MLPSNGTASAQAWGVNAEGRGVKAIRGDRGPPNGNPSIRLHETFGKRKCKRIEEGRRKGFPC